jgi:hypothetical protein
VSQREPSPVTHWLFWDKRNRPRLSQKVSQGEPSPVTHFVVLGQKEPSPGVPKLRLTFIYTISIINLVDLKWRGGKGVCDVQENQ